MKYSYAALHCCEMKGGKIDTGHHCWMECGKPMHGALCGTLFAKRGKDIDIRKAVLLAHGQELYDSHSSAVICMLCIEWIIHNHWKSRERLNRSTLKSHPEIVNVDMKDMDYKPGPSDSDDDEGGDVHSCNFSQDDIELIGVS